MRPCTWYAAFGAAALLMLLPVESMAASLVKTSIIRGQSNDGCHNYLYTLSFMAPSSGAVVATISGLPSDVILNSVGIVPGSQSCNGTCVANCSIGPATTDSTVSPLIIDLRRTPDPMENSGPMTVADVALLSDQDLYLVASGLTAGGSYTVRFDYDYCVGFTNCSTIEVFERVCP